MATVSCSCLSSGDTSCNSGNSLIIGCEPPDRSFQKLVIQIVAVLVHLAGGTQAVNADHIWHDATVSQSLPYLTSVAHVSPNSHPASAQTPPDQPPPQTSFRIQLPPFALAATRTPFTQSSHVQTTDPGRVRRSYPLSIAPSEGLRSADLMPFGMSGREFIKRL